MKSKLGLQNSDSNDTILIKDLLDLLPIYEADMTIFYRQLIAVNYDSTLNEAWEVLKISFYDVEQMPASAKDRWVKWIENYIERLEKQSAFAKARTLQMQQSNPKYVLRNYISQLVIEKAEEGNYDLLNEVYEMLKKPYEDQPEMNHWYAKRPDWARNKPGSSQLSCSS